MNIVIEPNARPVNPQRIEVLKALEPQIRSSIELYLKPIDSVWQPCDFLPVSSEPGWEEKLQSLRQTALGIPDILWVVLVGDMITEEALPSYHAWLNGLNGLWDASGTSDHAWAQWSRGWTAEENRHGDLLNRYLYLTGRVDMHAVEVTIQNLIRNGFNPFTNNDPYQGFVYTSFQADGAGLHAPRSVSRSGRQMAGTLCHSHGANRRYQSI